MSFSELGLNEVLMRAVARVGYSTPTPIQERSIPVILSGRDLLAAAQTGTGKTAAFTLPILEHLHRTADRRGKNPRVLVLTPTRELAAQVGESVREYGGEMPIRSTIIFGGVNINPQTQTLKRGVDVIIATPGRLLDHAQQGNVDLGSVDFFVLDEADRMLDMGFIHDIKKVMSRLPKKRQNLLFSATFSKEIRQLAKTFLHNPEEIDVAPRNSTTHLVEQNLVFCAKRQKRALLSWLISTNDWHQVLVFTRTKHGANRLCAQLTTDGLPAAALHGNKSQSARTKALQGFKAGDIRVLVATDIAARGLDIDQLPHVVNYELPNVPADYVHRIGRTGRAGMTGEAFSLVMPEERPLLKDINRLLGKEIPERKIEGFDFSALPAEEPDVRPPRQQQRRRPSGQQSGGQKRSQGGGKQSGGGQRRGKGGGNQSGNGGNAQKRDANGNIASNGQSNSQNGGQGQIRKRKPRRASGQGGGSGQSQHVHRPGSGNARRDQSGGGRGSS